MADSSTSLAGILYYAREKYYQHIQTEVLEVTRKYGAEPILSYWTAYSLVLSGRLLEGMRELEKILEKPDVVLCAPMLLAYAHKKCEIIDKQAVQKLETKIRTDRTTCGEKALYNAGMFLWLCGRHDKAREYVDRMLKMSPSSREGLSLKGWVDLTCGRESLSKRSIKYFEEALASPETPKLASALFGKSKFYLNRYNFSHSLDVVNQAVAGHEDFLPALIEKMKVQLALQDWDQAVETAHRCLSANKNCIEAVRMLTLHLLAREGKYEEAAGKIGELIQMMDRFEPNNHALYYDIALPFARMCGEKDLILQQTMTLIQRALSLAANNADYITELAYELYLNNQLKESLVQYKRAMTMDNTSIMALAGIIFCQILEGHISEAEQQLEFLAEVQASIGKQADLIFLTVLLAQKKNRPSSEVLPVLSEIIDIHFGIVKGTILSIKYFQLLNPHFILLIAKSLMIYAPTEPVSNPSQVHPILRRAAAVLDPLCKSMPGMLASLFQLARIKFLCGESEPAQAILQRIIDRDNSFMESHLLMARIHLHQGKVKLCLASLELALSSNFEVQHYPIYYLVKAQCERRSGDVEEALISLQTAMNFITRKSSTSSTKASKQLPSLLPPLTLSEQVTVYLELASVHNQLGHTHEATKVVQDAINEFTGTSEEFRITIANAEFALVQGNVEEALSLLKRVGEDNPYYIESKEKMAEIYLTKRKDKKMYIACYEELAKKLPGPPTSLILGDAYMSIQQPEKALEVYETALRRNVRDSILASKVGQALIKTHNYNKAIIYYETALKSETQQFLRRDLAELFLKLRQFDKAEKTIAVALERQDVSQLHQMVQRVQYMQLLSQVHREAKQLDSALKVLGNAVELQTKVLTRSAIEQPDALQDQKNVAASIYYDMAEMSDQAGDRKSAIKLYCEALKKRHEFQEVRLALAKLHLLEGDLTACDQECVILLRIDQDNEPATLMRTDLLFHKGHEAYQEAIHHLQELLGRKPAHFQALSRYVELARRVGDLEQVEAYLTQAEKACTRSAYEPGLNYCRGLYKRYRHKANDALQHFNQARKDTEWGERALFAMIEICLNPENDMIAGEMLKPMVTDSSSSSEDQIAIKTAEKLLLEVRPNSAAGEQKVRVLECYILLNSRAKPSIEKALEKLMVMASNSRNDVPLLLGIASAHMLLKQIPRARNQLKIASKVQWTPENAGEFEQAWLLLADIFIQSGKYDVALELLKKCITFNKSCSKAWEYRGFISEKEHAYKDAATYYEKAWQYNYHANPTVGFKLAFNYLKAKWHVEAIDVCHQVLEKHPNYPRIKKEILEKARASIRV